MVASVFILDIQLVVWTFYLLFGWLFTPVWEAISHLVRTLPTLFSPISGPLLAHCNLHSMYSINLYVIYSTTYHLM